MARSLWGEEFNLPTVDIKNIIKKAASPKKVVNSDPEKLLKSKLTPLVDKLNIINTNVLRVLGSYKDNTVAIKTKEQLVSYIDAAILNGVIAIDTETNNSLDPLTCKLMGPCIYTPGQKNAYIPLNHINPETGKRLEWQLTEQDVKEQFERLAQTTIIMHNGSFDYQVIKCTCGVELHVDWDTMVGARLLDENERAGLKGQYVDKVDASIEKYSINSFFAYIEYAVVDPDVFALYAATDAYMTYKLYLYQKNIFELPENERLFKVFKDIEMPIMKVAAEMELTGVEIDQDYAKRLAEAHRTTLEIYNKQIDEELEKLRPTIEQWRMTPAAQYRPPKKKVTKSGETLDKSKSEQLADPPVITSNTQLAILMYDILRLPVTDKDSPRGTGESVLEALGDKFPLGEVILKKRGLEKLLNTFVEAIPAQVCPKDGRLHAHFNTCGTDTGRFSSSSPNL